jgi:coenzyme F420-reducing hydrogenase alpha subunit
MTNKTINVEYLARVEGEGSLSLTIHDGKVKDAKLKIFEPPRFFEAFLQGRDCFEAADITARVCGICPVAYQMTAVHALERAAGIKVEGALRDLRRLLYCGEWIESHALHMFLLHAPDFLGYQDAVRMARDHPDIVETGLRIKKAGNEIVTLLGGREIHPINVRLGGFYSVPHKAKLKALADALRRGRDDMLKMLTWAAGLPFPDVELDYNFVALKHRDEYPMNEGRIASNRGLDIDVGDYAKHFREYQESHSTALYSILEGGSTYHVGPMARYALNHENLTPMAKEAAQAAGLGQSCINPFKSILVRGVEVVFAFEEALRVIDNYHAPDAPFVPVEPRAVKAYAATEAPRGLLYHYYEVDKDGQIIAARLVPPTSQNQKVIEENLKAVAEKFIDLPDEDLKWRCEQAIRNYDPCISCAAHFLKLDINRNEGLVDDC